MEAGAASLDLEGDVVNGEIIVGRGAEAIVEEIEFLGKKMLRKIRIPKRYREKELDVRLRRERTRSEARLLNRAKRSGVNAPVVYKVDEFEIVISLINGKKPEMNEEEAKEAGKMLARLHRNDIIHGDFTPANLLKTREGKMYVIDFGLGYVSTDVEDKAVDVFTMLRAIDRKKEFLEGYSTYEKHREVLNREKQVESRVRYLAPEERAGGRQTELRR